MTLVELLKKAGFSGEGLRMAYAICMAESHGRANATNSVGNSAGTDRGLFQINSYYHSEVSDAEAFDPLANAKAAYRISGGGKHWSQWSTYNNGAYRDYYGGSMGATVSGVGKNPSYSTYAGSTSTPKLSMEDMAARYGLAAEVLRQNKQIRDLVKEAIKNGYDQTLFTAKLKNTKWWRTTSDAQRKYFFLRASDPATYRQKHDGYAFSLNQLAVEVGLGSQLAKGNKPTAMLEKAIQYKMRDGWSDAQIKAYFGQSVGMHGNEMWGAAGEAYDQIFALAYANGLSFSKDWYTKNIRDVVSGKSTLETLQGYARNQAAAKYSNFADQIRAGQNAIDLAQPYISAVAQILELPQTDIDLSNKYVNKAMTSKAGPGQQPGTQYPLWQFENDLRNDPLWKKTNNARESMFSVAHQVAKDFGFAF